MEMGCDLMEKQLKHEGEEKSAVGGLSNQSTSDYKLVW